MESFTTDKATYEVKHLLGEGSFGIVYKVSPSHTEFEFYALKTLKITPEALELQTKELKQRFKREFECGQVHSNNVVRSIDYGYNQDNPFFVMEYCRNGTLESYCGTPDAIKFLWKWIEGILNGLKDLHGDGVIHRDLKPANILLDYDLNPKLTDFGISAFVNNRITRRDRKGRATSIFGTYAYIAPEQANVSTSFHALRPATDIFSLGVLIYYLVEGRLPFGDIKDAKSLAAYLKNAQNHKIRRSEKLSSVSKSLNQLVIEMLRPKIEDRPQAINEIIDALKFTRINPKKKFLKPLEEKVLLKVMHGEASNAVYNISEIIKTYSPVSIGYGRTTKVTMKKIFVQENNTAYISNQNCLIGINQQGQLIIVDGGVVNNLYRPSTNGTFINGIVVHDNPVAIKENDILTIGDTTLKFLLK